MACLVSDKVREHQSELIGEVQEFYSTTEGYRLIAILPVYYEDEFLSEVITVGDFLLPDSGDDTQRQAFSAMWKPRPNGNISVEWVRNGHDLPDALGDALGKAGWGFLHTILSERYG